MGERQSACASTSFYFWASVHPDFFQFWFKCMFLCYSLFYFLFSVRFNFLFGYGGVEVFRFNKDKTMDSAQQKT